jgi:hypothetical protein
VWRVLGVQSLLAASEPARGPRLSSALNAQPSSARASSPRKADHLVSPGFQVWSVPVRTAEFYLVMRRSDREPSGSHAPQQHPALRCSVRPTDRPFRPRISGGRTNTEVHPVANLQHNGPLQAVPSVQADPPARTPGSSGRLTLRVDGHSGPRHLARCRTWAKCRFWSKAGVDDKGRAQEPNRALRCLTAAETTMRP